MQKEKEAPPPLVSTCWMQQTSWRLASRTHLKCIYMFKGKAEEHTSFCDYFECRCHHPCLLSLLKSNLWFSPFYFAAYCMQDLSKIEDVEREREEGGEIMQEEKNKNKAPQNKKRSSGFALILYISSSCLCRSSTALVGQWYYGGHATIFTNG